MGTNKFKTAEAWVLAAKEEVSDRANGSDDIAMVYALLAIATAIIAAADPKKEK